MELPLGDRLMFGWLEKFANQLVELAYELKSGQGAPWASLL